MKCIPRPVSWIRIIDAELLRMIYIHLLRGINVGGHKKIPMAQLRICYEKLGLKNVRTYIQSGNVTFESDQPIGNDILEKSIQNVTGFDVPAMLFTDKEWREVVEHGPDIYDNTGKEIKKYITLLAGVPDPEKLEQLREKLSAGEVLTSHSRALYLYYPAELKKPFFTNTAVEKVLGLKGTTRNWNTVKALEEMNREG